LDDFRIPIDNCYPETVTLLFSRHIAIDTSGMPSRLVTTLKKLATIANPVFFKAQHMRKSTWNIPRYICCADFQNNQLCLPRGLLDACRQLLQKAGAKVECVDERKRSYMLIPASFSGELQPEQVTGLNRLLSQGSGVLVAPPGAGKTVIGCALIGEIKLPTLILVHRKQLAEQWKSQLLKFLSVDKKSIGLFNADIQRRSGIIDIGMIQTFARLPSCEQVLSDYGVIIVDECHHVPAPSFEPAMRNISALYFVGLTATPYRKDGLQAIIHMQCGPTVYTMEESAAQSEIARKVIVKETAFRMPPESPLQPPLHEIWNSMVRDETRIIQVVEDVLEVLHNNCFPLILSDRRDHLERLFEEISRRTDGLRTKGFLLTSDMGKKVRKKILVEIQEMLSKNEQPFILSTGALIGEGFDLPKLSALFLTMPISFKGRLVQYAGRLHRESHGKKEVTIYDYVDSNLGLGISMFRKRVTAYRKMGYTLEIQVGSRLGELISNKQHKVSRSVR
jgi:superfamily II DNA or RNA helicase